MRNPTACPPGAEFEPLVTEYLDAPERRPDFAAHLDACDACQTRVELLLDRGEPAALRKKLRPPTDGPLPRVPGYEVLGRLGRGGMGVVFKARHLRLNRLVALKMIRTELATAEQARRFEVEALAAARLHHPNLVQIYEVAECDGLPCLALEYVEGGTLAEALGHKPLAPREAAALLLTLTRAVEAAHAGGVVHRDLKPTNVLLGVVSGQWSVVSQDWRSASSLTTDHWPLTTVPKITDFGLAKTLDDPAGPTLTGQVMGTPEYMAPEQAGGAKDVGPLADVWALGAILYECLTGRPPFQGTSPLETLRRVVADEPAPPASLQPGTPRDLETVCLKCLRKEPGGRYPSAGELADDLERYLAGRPVRARRAGAARRAWSACRRNPVVAALAAAVFLLLTLSAAGGLLLALSLQSALTEATQAARDGKRQLIDAYLAEADANRRSRLPGQRFVTLDRLRAALALADEVGVRPETRLRARNLAIAALCLPDLQPGREWAGEMPAWVEPETRRKVSAALALGRLRPPLPPDRAIDSERGRDGVSPDGRYVAFNPKPPEHGNEGFYQVWRVDGTDPVLVLDGIEEVGEEGIAFRPDSQEVAFGHTDGSVGLHDLRTGKPVTRLATGLGPVFCLAYHPREPKLAVAAGNDVAVWDLTTKRRLARLPHPSTTVAVAWHPRGHRLATACQPGGIHLWDTETGRAATPVWDGENRGGLHLRFDVSGDRLVSSGWEWQFRLWDAVLGRQLLAIRGWPMYDFSLADGPRGTERRIADGREVGLLKRTTAAGTEVIRGVGCHPDGRLVALLTPTGVAFLDLHTREEAAFLGGFYGHARFDQTGHFWTANEAGLLRWPVRSAGPTGFRVGPPEWVADVRNQGVDGFGLSAAGDVFAVPLYLEGALLVRRAAPRQADRLGPQFDVRGTNVSPDGRWVFTRSHWLNGQAIRGKLWEVESRRPVAVVPAAEVEVDTGFSADSRWLNVVGKRSCRLEVASLAAVPTAAVPTWQAGWRTERPAPPASSPVASLAAWGEKGGLRLSSLADPDGTLGVLHSPEGESLEACGFTPDGTRLLALGTECATLYVFDLRRIREQLAELGLDWDLPPYPPATADERTPALRVELVGGEWSGSRQKMAEYETRTAGDRLRADGRDADAHFRLGVRLLDAGKDAEAGAHLAAALALRPAMHEAMAPRASAALRLGRWREAEAWATAGLAWCPFDSRAREVRGQARIQLGRHAEAVEDYSAILACYPRIVRFYDRRAECYAALGRDELARADRAQAIKVSGQTAPTPD